MSDLTPETLAEIEAALARAQIHRCYGVVCMPCYRARCDHLLRTHAAALVASARRVEAISKDQPEWLCDRCNVIHAPQPGRTVLQPCPDCGEAMRPTSYTWRRLEDAEKNLAAAKQARQAAERERDDWKNAVIDATVCNWTYQDKHENDPRAAVNALLAWESQVALDPAVSEPAAKLYADRDALAAETARLRAALERLGDWRLDKMIQHVAPGGDLRALAKTKAENDLIDRYHGWGLMAREIIDAALGAATEA